MLLQRLCLVDFSVFLIWKRLTFHLVGDGDVKRREEARKADQAPSDTLFVVNFDRATTRERDLEAYFNEFGAVRRVRLRPSDSSLSVARA